MRRWHSQAMMGVLAVVGLISVSARADVYSKNANDPYSLRYNKAQNGSTVLELCGPKGCRALGPIQLDLNQKELSDLRRREKFQYYSNEAAGPILWIALPLSGWLRGVASAKFTLKVSEKFLPFVTKKLYEKFGEKTTLTGATYVASVANTAEMIPVSSKIVEELFNAEENQAALDALSDKAIQGQNVHVDFSIEQLARHLEAELIEKAKAKELVEEGIDDSPFDWPI